METDLLQLSLKQVYFLEKYDSARFVLVVVYFGIKWHQVQCYFDSVNSEIFWVTYQTGKAVFDLIS